ncbi:hypothetical protein M0R45_000204 [Rubus argutus]|uniref:Uncharacterized protein n=1 Tax=Rubus argutus TaxID=59490 RepID=A0AAW1VS34_RUBAR
MLSSTISGTLISITFPTLGSSQIPIPSSSFLWFCSSSSSSNYPQSKMETGSGSPRPHLAMSCPPTRNLKQKMDPKEDAHAFSQGFSGEIALESQEMEKEAQKWARGFQCKC